MSSPNPLYNDDACCDYWQELDDASGATGEFCRFDKKKCFCCGSRTDCSNGQWMPVIIEDYDEER